MLPKVDLSDIADELKRLGEEIQRAWDEAAPDLIDAEQEPAPQVLLHGLGELLDRLRASDAETPTATARALRAATGSEPEGLLEHGLLLLGQLARVTDHLRLHAAAQSLQELVVPLSCWMIRQGTELRQPEPVVHALATLANRLREPEDLAGLFALMGEIAEGISQDRVQGMDPKDPTDPWRVLLLNRGIVATRSHQPALMDEAFAAIVEQLPEDAPHFFREGMGQMEALDYPPAVRETMQRYFERWCSGQRLH
jgi:hypothetical protein